MLWVWSEDFGNAPLLEPTIRHKSIVFLACHQAMRHSHMSLVKDRATKHSRHSRVTTAGGFRLRRCADPPPSFIRKVGGLYVSSFPLLHTPSRSTLEGPPLHWLDGECEQDERRSCSALRSYKSFKQTMRTEQHKRSMLASWTSIILSAWPERPCSRDPV